MKSFSLFRILLACVMALGLLVGRAPTPAGADAQIMVTWSVNDAGDEPDAVINGTCATAGGKCTLRAAIMEANDPFNVGSHIIGFSGNYEIALMSNLPSLADESMRIDAIGHTVSITKPPSGTATRGLYINTNYCRIHNLTITGFENGIMINGHDNYIGVYGDGTNDTLEGNRIINNTDNGVYIVSGARNWIAGNLIGLDGAGNTQPNGTGIRVNGPTAYIGTNGDGTGDQYEGNVISANLNFGIDVTSGGGGSIIAGNIIGLKADGTTTAGNGMNGILVSGPNNVRIGSDGSGGTGDGYEGNVISGNEDHGIRIDSGSGHKISGNTIGLDKNGVNARGNDGQGIEIASAAYNITIGVDENDDPANSFNERNVISANTLNGIYLQGYQVTVAGNIIGLNKNGDTDRGNGQNGIHIAGHDNTIGTDGDNSNDANEANTISGNDLNGIVVGSADADNNYISGNLIGTDKVGAGTVGNSYNGISLQNGPAGTHIGVRGIFTSDSYERNTISGNGRSGIDIVSADGALIYGNYIGTNKDGTADRGNASHGIYIEANNDSTITIGVPSSGRAAHGNLISGNTNAGIMIESSDNHIIAGNFIGTSANGQAAIPNDGNGVQINNSANIRIGTDGDSQVDNIEGNLISGNGQSGIQLSGATTTGTVIAGNLIGTAGNGGGDLGNTHYGIYIFDSAANTRIGTDGNGTSDSYERNTISNNLDGIYLQSAGNTAISGNCIGTDVDGNANGLGNSSMGITVQSGVSGVVTIGIPNGGIEGMRNIISGNGSSGIWINGTSAAHVIAGNWIGMNADGDDDISNSMNGIILENASNVRIGTDGNGQTDTLEKNIISGNDAAGIYITGASAANNIVAGNWIGIEMYGMYAMPNGNSGIVIIGGPAGTRIGTDGNGVSDSYESNVISGNSASGILLGTQTGTVIAGNIIGLSATTVKGSAKVPNSGNGIWIQTAAKPVTPTVGAVRIGTDGSNDTHNGAEGNTISGNTTNGIQIDGGSGHIIAGNRIGVDVTGLGSALGNGDNGIVISMMAEGNIRIGTNGDGIYDTAERNIISANASYGVQISADNNILAGNYIGADGNGDKPSPNGFGGVMLRDGATGNVIGMNSNGSAGEAAEGNVISGNGDHGLIFENTAGNQISGNIIGLKASGTAALPNQGQGIRVENSPNEIIGTDSDGTNDSLEGNFISGNLGDGIYLWSNSTNNTLIRGNIIGLAGNGTTPIGNGGSGISVDFAQNTKIGGALAAQANRIGGNTYSGIYLTGILSGTQIIGNDIGVASGGAPAGNGEFGVYLDVSSAGKATEITLVQSNRIHNNTMAGIFVNNGAGNGHKFLSNSFANNDGLGIDLFPFGVDVNDDQDSDFGPNGLQNHPLVTNVSFPNSGQIRVEGSFNSTPSSTFTIELYASSAADPSGYGEGLTPFHSFSVSTNASGNATFDVTVSYSYGLAYNFFTALATAGDGSTSEFGPTLEYVVLHIYLPVISR